MRRKRLHLGSQGASPAMLRQFQRLALVVRGADLTVKSVRLAGHSLVSEAANGLSVLKHDRDLVAADFEDGAAARAAVRGGAEAGVEEAGVMDPELAHHWIDRHHLGGVAGRDVQLLFRDKNVELVRVEDQPLVGARPDRLPIILDGVGAGPVDVDDVGVALRTVADYTLCTNAAQLDMKNKAMANL